MSSLGFWNTALESPDSVVIFEEGGRALRAGEVLARANQIVHGLRRWGLKPGDTVAVLLSSRAEFLEVALAALQAGWYFVPMAPSLTAREMLYLLTDSEAKVVVLEPACWPDFQKARSQMAAPPSVFVIGEVAGASSWEELWNGESGERPEARTPGDSLFYTSGTTGLAKAVRRPLGTVPLEKVGRVSAVHLNAVCGIRPKSSLVHLVCSPLTHSASLLWCLDHLHLGHAVVLKQSSGVETVLGLIERYQVTGALMVPTHLFRLLQLPENFKASADLKSLRHVVHTGAPCPPAIKSQMLDWWGDVLYEVYGAAEGGGTRATPQEWRAKPGTVGKGYGRIRILDSSGQLCPAGQAGAVYIKLGPRPFRYHNDADKTEAAVADGFFSVGDHGYLDQDDFLFLCGRSSEILISGGVNVYPVEVEAVLAEHPLVAEAAVFGVPDPEFGQRLCAFVVRKTSSQTDQELRERLRAHCRTTLSSPKRPRQIFFVESLPRNRNGKLERRALAALPTS